MQKKATLITLHLRFDSTEFDIDSLLLWMGNVDTKVTDIRLAEAYLNKGDYIMANAILENIPNKFELDINEMTDLQDVQFIFNLLAAAPDGLSIAAQNSLELIAEKPANIAPYMARGVLIQYGRHFLTEYYLPGKFNDERGGSEKRVEGEHLGKPILKPHQFSIYPNPAKDYTVFSWNKERTMTKKGQLIITNSVGVEVGSYSISADDTSLKWVTTTMENGIYFYKFMQGKVLIESGKVIILK